jgi:hypothetical protein
MGSAQISSIRIPKEAPYGKCETKESPRGEYARGGDTLYAQLDKRGFASENSNYHPMVPCPNDLR